MARKWAGTAIVIYFLILVFMYLYLFNGDTSLPQQWIGTAADPATFLNARELMLSEQYSQIRNFMFFAYNAFDWIVYFFILLFGLSRVFERVAASQSKWKIVQAGVYLFLLSLLSYVVTFPLSYISYNLSKSYHISTQTFSSWMKDGLIDFWVNFGQMVIIVSVLYWLINKSPKRWWFHAWLLSIPFFFFMMFIQPVVIDPLYNDFYPLKNKELETEILKLASQADIPAEHVYEVNMAEKTNALNAYVTGIGANSRIVLWDTTLNRLKEKEILVIMAHEMGHYVEKHIYIGIAGYLILTFAGLWLTARLMKSIITRYGKVLKITGVGNLSSLPLFLLITAMLLFASSPLSNFVSRYQEERADQYAMEMLEDKESAITMFQELTRSGLSQVNPPLLVKWFRYSHPTMLERIISVENYHTVEE
ncbi:M48 family metallopeptidase [Peribacillus sp. FSL H8-0477]|uniref:M48 family metallopeptidase n=1 Tax=Peribacillus sp. FSL H8-0477 TaxID=2921388 RepID=UPI0030FA533C